jgi:hypothetical protein
MHGRTLGRESISWPIFMRYRHDIRSAYVLGETSTLYLYRLHSRDLLFAAYLTIGEYYDQSERDYLSIYLTILPLFENSNKQSTSNFQT